MKASFYIALRYLISKKGSQAVSFITGLAIFAMTVAVMAMFVVISIFSGLENLNKELIKDLHADLTIRSKGKQLQNIDEIISVLSKESDVQSFSKVIEEKIYINYGEKGEIAYLRGVDENYVKVNPIHRSVIYGKYPSFEYEEEVIMEGMLNGRLGIPISTPEEGASAQIMVPKPGEGLIQKEQDIFSKKQIFVTGIFSENEQLNSYVISPIELAQDLLGLPENSAYQIVIQLKNPEKSEEVKRNILDKISSTTSIVINTQLQENAAFWKMINTEKMMIYLIFFLVISITTFNLAGAIVILQLDKKQQAKSLISLGLSIKNLRYIYFNTGFLITVFGVVFGLFLGTLLCLFQLHTGFFKASAGLDLAFPVRITMFNYLITASVALLLGLVVSWVFSKINRENLSLS